MKHVLVIAEYRAEVSSRAPATVLHPIQALEAFSSAAAAARAAAAAAAVTAAVTAPAVVRYCLEQASKKLLAQLIPVASSR